MVFGVFFFVWLVCFLLNLLIMIGRSQVEFLSCGLTDVRQFKPFFPCVTVIPPEILVRYVSKMKSIVTQV